MDERIPDSKNSIWQDWNIISKWRANQQALERRMLSGEMDWRAAYEQQRSGVLNILLGVAVVGGLLAVIPSLLNVFRNPQQLRFEVLFVLSYLVVVLAFALRKLDYRIRLAVPVIGIYLVGVLILRLNGIASHGVWYLMLAPLLLFSLSGWRVGIVSLGVSALIYAFFAIGHYWGWIPIRLLPDPRIFEHLMNVTTAFVLMLAIVGVAQGLFNRTQERASRAIYEQAKSLTLIQTQLEQRADALRKTNEQLQVQTLLLNVTADVLSETVGFDDVEKVFSQITQQLYGKLREYGVMCVGIFTQERHLGQNEHGLDVYPESDVESERPQQIRRRAFAGKSMMTWSVQDIPQVVVNVFNSGKLYMEKTTLEKEDMTSQVSSVSEQPMWELACPLRMHLSVARDLVSEQQASEFMAVLYIRSGEHAVFQVMDRTVLQTLTDQLSVALQNVILLQQARAQIESMNVNQLQYTQKVWQDLFARGAVFASGPRSIEAKEHISPVVLQAVRESKPMVDNVTENVPSILAVPIKMRDEVIGVVDIQHSEPGLSWSQEELALVNAVVGQLGTALDSARLYQDSQRRAEREQITGNITTAMRASLDIETVLETAVREIGAALKLHDLTIELARGNEERP
ncbi:MAG: GAF domain-containing protein [Anaerolineae bacterium]|nr:GAF domain-containing protein [Anaerolineae bacterium]